MEADIKRQIKIKSGSVRRLAREYQCYEQEIQKEKKRLNEFQESGEAESKLKRQEEVIQESISMLPNTRRRLQEAVDDLQDYMKENDTDPELMQTEEWREAEEHIVRARDQILQYHAVGNQNKG